MSLVASALTVGYEDRVVLENLDFQVTAGEFSCLLGPNGAGKSTLVRALAGTLPVTGGEVCLGGEALHSLSPRQRAQRIGYLPQEIHPSFSLTVRESVDLGVRVAGRKVAVESKLDKRAGRSGAVAEALQQVDAEDLAERRLDELSGGERRRVLLAGVLAQQPQFLLLDEPASMLDLGHQAELFNLMRRLSRQGLGVLCVTHDLNLAGRFADRLHLLGGPSQLQSGTPTEILSDSVIRNTFGPHFQLIETPDGPPAVLPAAYQSLGESLAGEEEGQHGPRRR